MGGAPGNAVMLTGDRWNSSTAILPATTIRMARQHKRSTVSGTRTAQ